MDADQHGPRISDRFAERLKGFGPIGILATFIIPFALTPWIGAVLAILWAHRSRTPLSELGYRHPGNWWVSTIAGVAIGVTLKLVMKAVVMPLLGADPVNNAYQYLTGNRAALPGMIFAVTVGAGFGEETVYRGFLFARFRRLFGGSLLATLAIVLLTSAWFGIVHYPAQGWTGVEQAVVTGLVFGTIFTASARIWLPMVAHAAFDLTAVVLIYRGLESNVAHWLFK